MRATIPSNMPRGVSGYKSPNKSSYITNYNKYKQESYNTQKHAQRDFGVQVT